MKATNKIIKYTLKIKTEERKGNWPKELQMVLWSYNTTPRSTTGELTFTLTYGCKVMVPVEIGAGSFRRDNYNFEGNEVKQRLYLDLVEETRASSQIILAAYYNTKVKAFPLKVGDLVLRKMMPNMRVRG